MVVNVIPLAFLNVLKPPKLDLHSLEDCKGQMSLKRTNTRGRQCSVHVHVQMHVSVPHYARVRHSGGLHEFNEHDRGRMLLLAGQEMAA